MKYNVINVFNRENLNNYNTLFVYSEDYSFDNRFCIFETDKYNFGFSYYYLGISERFVVVKDILFMGFGTTVFIYNLIQQEILYVMQDALQVIYEIYSFEHLNKVVYLCENKLLCFTVGGINLFEHTYNSSIVDWAFDDNVLSLKLEDNRCLKIQL